MLIRLFIGALMSTAVAVGPTSGAIAQHAVGSGKQLIVGVNDDYGKFEDPAANWFYPTMQSEGMGLNAITVRWDDQSTVPIAPDALIQVTQAIAKANAAGVSVELDLYPLRSQVFTNGQKCAPSADPQFCGNGAALAAFGQWAATIAQTFPSVHQFVVMNECNQPLFVNPQFNSAGANQSAAICGQALVAAYDALKGVSPSNIVWGVGLSPRGNDVPGAASNASTSPVSFLRALGSWYRSYVAKTHRTAPLMDGLDFHPYPIPQSLPFASGYPSMKDASVSNLPRIYQAFYLGFKGTPQRTIGQQAGGGLPVSLNETGIQTKTSGHSGYIGTETSANGAGGVVAPYDTETYQATWYRALLSLTSCDPNVTVVNIFHLIDEPLLGGWQSGLYYADQAAKQSAGAVQSWIASTHGACQGASQPWTPGTGLGAKLALTNAVVAGSGGTGTTGGQVRILSGAKHKLSAIVHPFGLKYKGPVSVAVADVNGDDLPDLIAGEGPGGSPKVAIISGRTGKALATRLVFPAKFRGGVTVAAGDINGNGLADVVVGMAGGGGQVKIYRNSTGKVLRSATPFGGRFKGGVSVASGDVNGDGLADLIVGTASGKPQIMITSSATAKKLGTLAPSITGGLAVAAGDVNGDGKADVVVGAANKGQQIKVFKNGTKASLGSLSPFKRGFKSGVTVAAGDVDGDGPADVTAGQAHKGNQLRVRKGTSAKVLVSAVPFGAKSTAGLSVGGS